MQSIHRQLQTSLALALAVSGLVLFSLCFYLLDRQMRVAMTEQLQRDADTLAAAIFKQQNHPQDIALALDETRLHRRYNTPYSGEYFAISTGNNLWRSRSWWDFALPEATASAATNTQLFEGPRKQSLLVVHKDYTRFGQKINIQVARDYAPTRAQLKQLAGLLGGLFGFFALALMLLQGYIIRRGLTPLAQLTQQINALRDGNRADINSQAPTELVPLIEELKRLLNNTETTLRRARAHLSNLGHALKTPLAVLYTKLATLEASLKDPIANEVEASVKTNEIAASQAQLTLTREQLTLVPEQLTLVPEQLTLVPEQLTLMREQLDIIKARIERELVRARLAGEVLPGSYFIARQELPDLVRTLNMIHRRPLKITQEYPAGLQLLIDREDALELIGNLLDNACKWAKHSVSFSIHLENQDAAMTVADDGAGLDPALQQQLPTRGQRLDEATPGHGVGLSVVRDICEHWGATLKFGTSTSGGLAVKVLLPAPLIHIDESDHSSAFSVENFHE